MKLKHLDLFSGIGGFSLGLEATGGFETVAFCDIEEFPRKVLQKHWPGVKQYEDIKELNYEKLKTDGLLPIDIITGGYPCQPFSVAGRKKVKKIRDISGQSILDLSKSSGQLGLLEKMLVDTLNLVSTPYSRTWRVKVTPSGRLVFQLRASVPTTKEKESGLWQTPTAVGIKERSPEALERKMKKRKEIGRSTVPPGSLMEQIQLSPNRNQKPKWNMWSTPTTFDRYNIQKPRKKHPGGGQKPPLCQQVMWRTPDAHCDRGPSSEERMKMKLDKGMPISLNDQVKHPNLMWPTPRANTIVNKKERLSPEGRLSKDGKQRFGLNLQDAVTLWPTPKTSDQYQAYMKKNEKGIPHDVAKGNLRGTVMWPTPRAARGMAMRLTENIANLRHKRNLESEVAYQEHKAEAPGKGGGTLNPTWVEWLMGYPLGHTDLKD